MINSEKAADLLAGYLDRTEMWCTVCGVSSNESYIKCQSGMEDYDHIFEPDEDYESDGHEEEMAGGQ